MKLGNMGSFRSNTTLSMGLTYVLSYSVLQKNKLMVGRKSLEEWNYVEWKLWKRGANKNSEKHHIQELGVLQTYLLE